jgi:predicted nucleic acid-binding protein
MRYLVDTNVLFRTIQNSHPMQRDAVRAIKLLLHHSEAVFIIPQNIIEFWAVATRPESQNGLGLSVNETAQQIGLFKSLFMLLPDNDSIFPEWEELVRRHQVLGKQVYDARLVAAMMVHSLTHLLTFNTNDFKRFGVITATNPQAIMNDQSLGHTES